MTGNAETQRSDLQPESAEKVSRWQDPLVDVKPKPARFKAAMRMPKASRSYLVFFTARSSSTRLCAAANATGQLGNPREWFDPASTRQKAGPLGATSLRSYVSALFRARAPGGIFGAELTWWQMRRTFGNVSRFRSVVPADDHIWLIRRDIVAQAISVERTVQTGVAHTARGSREMRETADDRFVYDGDKIRWRIENLHKQEQACEAYFERFEIAPLRLCYEQLSRLSDSEIAGLLADHLKIELTSQQPIQSGHSKLGGSKAAEFAERFRNEYADFLSELDAARAPILARFPD